MDMENADVWETFKNFKNQKYMRSGISFLMFLLLGCGESVSNKPAIHNNSNDKVKDELLLLERKWLEAEFALDTAYVSTLMDPTFIAISANRISTKQEELKGMYDNISAMRQDSVFLDSLNLENAVVNVYGNSAVVTFIVHTYKKEKGIPTEKRTRFYDVWINRDGEWKAVSSQGTTLTQNQ